MKCLQLICKIRTNNTIADEFRTTTILKTSLDTLLELVWEWHYKRIRYEIETIWKILIFL